MKSKEVTSYCTRLYMLLCYTTFFYSRSWCWCPTRGPRKLFLQWQNREMQYSVLLYDQWDCSALTKTQGVSHCCDSLSILQKSVHSITHCLSTSCRCMLLHSWLIRSDNAMPYGVVEQSYKSRLRDFHAALSLWLTPPNSFLLQVFFFLTCLW